MRIEIMNRIGEKGTEAPVRNSRYVQKSNYWYYTTREGVDIGPFDSFSEAEIGASDFIDFIIHAEPSIIQTLQRYGRAVA